MNKFLRIVFALLLLFLNPVYTLAEEPQVEDSDAQQQNVSETVDGLQYDYSDTHCVPIKLSITRDISTKDNLLDGQELEFQVVQDVFYNGKIILKSGDIVKGHVENVITAGMNGFPAEILLDRFEFPGIRQSQLMSEYTKKGQNRCFWVYPLKWSLTLIPFVGSLTNLIMGGHANIKTSDIITVYYYPNWK